MSRSAVVPLALAPHLVAKCGCYIIVRLDTLLFSLTRMCCLFPEGTSSQQENIYLDVNRAFVWSPLGAPRTAVQHVPLL